MAKYDELRTIVGNAGFYSTSPEDMGTWDRIVVANKRSERGLGGTSFWVSLIHGRWYLGTWGGTEYSAANFPLLCDFVLHTLAENHVTVAAFEPSSCARFMISTLDDNEFDKVIAP